ncbi:MAG: hypothetical protein Q8939_02240 [Bacteroidota bacterium]|nr:hypothetical protein [Bacteroidota bacterium]
MRVNEVRSNQEGAGGTIQVFTSEQVSATDLASYIKINPSVKFDAELTENGLQIHSDQFDAEKSYQLNLHKGLHGKIGGTLQEDYFNNITFGELEPAIRSGSPEIIRSRKGNINYYGMQEGISANGTVKESDNFIRVRKRFFNRYGTPVSGKSFKQNELLIVQISVQKSFSGDAESLVVTDLLPAGFEMENPRTKEIPGMEWIKDDYKPTALDVRDDRINLFVNLNNPRPTYYHAVRAVSPGVFKMGPVSADGMYNGEYHSYNGGGLIRITE